MSVGIIRVNCVDLKVKPAVQCADFVTNSTLAAIWSMDDDQLKKQDEPRSTTVFCVSSERNPITWGNIFHILMKTTQLFCNFFRKSTGV